MLSYCLFVCFSLITFQLSECSVDVNIAWDQFLDKHNPQWSWEKEIERWKNLLVSWEQGGFIGNGLLGAVILNDNQTQDLIWRVARTDIWDHRQKGAAYSLNDFSYDKPRLPVGSFRLTTLGTPHSGTMFLALYNATFYGSLSTTKGNVRWTSFAHATLPIIVIDISISGNENVTFEFEPAPAVSPRNFSRPNPNYLPNPSSFFTQSAGINFSQQGLLAGGGHVTAWQHTAVNATHSTLFLSIGFDTKSLNSAQSFAASSVSTASGISVSKLLEDHASWWQGFYQQSFVSFPDTKMEGFYYIQMYKLASGTRADKPPLDMLGPWMTTETPWPDLHWDLNVQVTYWPLYVSNHLDIAESLPILIHKNLANLQKNVNGTFANSIALPGASSNDLLTSCNDNLTSSCLVVSPQELGNLMWVCHNLWMHYRYSMDLEYLTEVFYPILQQAVNFYINLASFNEQDSKFHLPVSSSPEYSLRGPDANYDISLFRWGLRTLLNIALNILNVNDPHNIAMWQKYNATLVDYPADNSTGFLIARDIPLSQSHHLYSHLFMIYPLHVINYGQPDYMALIEQSVDHWCKLNTSWRGHSWTGAASMSALLGRSDAAVGNLTFFVNGGCQSTGQCAIGPNTMYWDENDQWACIETSLSVASTIHELFLQSWNNGIIHVFPAVGSQWSSAVFFQFLAEGGFTVSAKWINTSTEFIQISSTAGSPCTIKTNIPTPIIVDPPYPIVVTPAPEPGWSFVTVKITTGQTTTLFHQGTGPNFTIEALPGDPAFFHFWGFH